MRELLMPLDEKAWLEMRAKDITSTEISVLFGISPYMTPYELWHRKKAGTVDGIEPNDRMKWGTRLQNTIGNGIAEDNGWTIRAIKEYMRVPRLRIGSSFDFFVDEPFMAILEIKNVDGLAFKQGWIVDDENIEAPVHIELQVQHQLLVTGMKKAYIGAFVGGNKPYLIERVPDDSIHKEIIQKVGAFWKSIEANEPPPPDFQRDAKFISKINQVAQPGKTIDASHRIEVLANDYRQAAEKEKDFNRQKETIKAEIITLIGDAERIKGEKFSIHAGVVGPAHVEYDREGYRNFKVTFKKERSNEQEN